MILAANPAPPSQDVLAQLACFAETAHSTQGEAENLPYRGTLEPAVGNI